MSRHLDPDWLREHYVDKQLSTGDIAKLVGRDPKSVYNQLRVFGIQTRPRGANLAGADNFMQLHPGENPFKGKRHTAETRAILSEKASTPKPHLRGERNGMSGRRGANNPNYQGGSSPERQRQYASSEWRELQRVIYARDGYRCRRCGAGKTERRGLHAHHIQPWAKRPELRFDLANIVTLCRTCHQWVHSKTNSERAFLAA